jgi:hypothetical protein
MGLTPGVKAAFAVGGIAGQVCGTIAAFFLVRWTLRAPGTRAS